MKKLSIMFLVCMLALLGCTAKKTPKKTKYEIMIEKLGFKAETISPKEIKLTWNDLGDYDVQIFRYERIDRDPEPSDLKVIIRDNSTSYIDKKLEEFKIYSYEARVVKRGQKIFTGEVVAYGYDDACAGVVTPCFGRDTDGGDDYYYTGPDNSKDSIELEIDYYELDGLYKVRGIELYRSLRGKNDFEKLAEFKNPKHEFKYKDTAVEENTRYDYKLRAYAIVNNEKVYSDYSLIREGESFNKTAQYDIEFTKVDNKHVYLTMKGDPNNDVLEFDRGFEYDYKGLNEGGELKDLRIVRWTNDNKKWIKNDKVKILTGETVTMLLKGEEAFDFRKFKQFYSDSHDENLKYGYSSAEFTFYLQKHNAKAEKYFNYE